MTLFLLAATIAVDAAARKLAAAFRLAMKRADLSLDYVSRVIGVPPNKLSNQLLGKVPFTAAWRFFVGEMRETGFASELLAIFAADLDRALLPRGVVVVYAEAPERIPKRMAKASLSRTVRLPLSDVKEAM